LREHGEALETDFGTIKLNAELISDERLADWIEVAASAAEMHARKRTLKILTTKMQGLECMMVDPKDRMAGIKDDFL
jgi:hypothetical protein